MNFIKKALIYLVIFSLVMPTSFVLAFVNYPSPSEAMGQIMTDLGMNEGELEKSISNLMDVNNYKKTPASVTLSFVPVSPVPGKELTAIATPSYFTGNPDQMYYTWYLKHKECKEADEEDQDYVSDCDLNKDDRVDEEDWKIEAMKLLANGGEDSSLFDYSGDPDSDADDDSYDSVFGGEDQKGKPAHCYVKDLESGIDYEMMFSETARVPGTNPEFHHYNPDGWEYEGRNAVAFVLCNNSPIIKSCRMVDTDGVLPDYPLKKLVKPDGSVWLEKCREHFYEDVESFTLIGHEQITCLAEDGTEYIYGRGFINGDRWAFGAGFGTCRCDEETPPVPECKHLFPKKYYLDKNDEVKVKSDGDDDLLVGDPGEDEGDKFTLAEEKFWGTNPNSKDTNNDGISDEEALVGKGAMKFKWTFEAGDQIGVAIEGVTDNTEYKDSSLKTMWGLVNNDFDGDNGCNIEPYTPSESPDNNSLQKNITLGVDLNDCLKENFIDPPQGTADKKIDVSLSYLPQYPINDETGNSSDELTISSSLLNIEDRSFVKYAWTLEGCADKSNEHCTVLDKNMLKDYETQLVKTIGIGLDSIRLKLQFPARLGMSFLKVTLRATESTDQASTKMGEKSIFIPLQENKFSIKKYPALVDASKNPPALSSAATESDCQDKICPAVKQEIIGLKVSGISGYDLNWSLNGKPLMSKEGSESETYFPILKDPGFQYLIRLDLSKDKEKITLTRDFKVEEPRVVIEPGCENNETGCVPPKKVEIGKFIDPKYLDTVKEIDYDENIFQAEKGSVITIRPSFNFDSSLLKKFDTEKNGYVWKINWFVDGALVGQKTADPASAQIDENGNLKLPISKENGEKYNISVEALYTQSGDTKRALTDLWGIQKEFFYEKNVSDSAEIEVANASSPITSSGTKKLMASLFSQTPQYLVFLFRVALSLALILFSTRLLFSLFPKQKIS